MTYEEAKQTKDTLNKLVDDASKVLNSFPKNEIGLIPDDVRNSEEYQIAQRNFDNLFSQLRTFNSFFVKNFRKKRTKRGA